MTTMEQRTGVTGAKYLLVPEIDSRTAIDKCNGARSCRAEASESMRETVNMAFCS